ncbi:Gfo/Idh/MocA family oxidoreductase [Flavobacterium panacagri]|uniref:Gfo/Idh/MocA family oxidoreductase n=1 Tax=Flavobacterium panacagri TaxID=3034146 RepID=UPI0025A60BD8|nr:Gfo/Idh/MocA family oxidoreductase [Flavobacterium panacagri]
MDSNIKKCLIIGAGQLGSRHLQGLVKYLEQLEIYVLDPSESSLKVAQEREKEINHIHRLIYTKLWSDLPQYFDLVIVATSANVREQIINKLLEKHKVKFLILEKVLFQDLDAYQRISLLLDQYNTITYVNHPRRMFQSYNELKESIQTNGLNIYNIVGGNWGLGCNALHFLDLLVYISGKKIREISVSTVEDEIIKSPREGFVEFTGTLTGYLEDKSPFSITSFKADISPITVTICNNEQRFFIQEGGTPQVYSLELNNSFKLFNRDFRIQYQSELTSIIVRELFEVGFCSLPSFAEARHTHELFIKAMLEKYNKIAGLQTKVLPIT